MQLILLQNNKRFSKSTTTYLKKVVIRLEKMRKNGIIYKKE